MTGTEMTRQRRRIARRIRQTVELRRLTRVVREAETSVASDPAAPTET